jgi:hypothetical protein
VTAAAPPNVLLVVAGLGNALLEPPYIAQLARDLPRWRVVQLLLRTAGPGWGTGSLAGDAADLAVATAHYRPDAARIVLLGHSTGCQSIATYLRDGGDGGDGVDGYVLQAGVSDREYLEHAVPRDVLAETCRRAGALVAAGDGQETMRRSDTAVLGPAPCSAARWLSLASPGHDGPDDLFSSDLDDAAVRTTWAALARAAPGLVLLGARDEFMPPGVDKAALLARWTTFVREAGGVLDPRSAVVEGATHDYSGCGEEPLRDLVRRVSAFLDAVDGNEA